MTLLSKPLLKAGILSLSLNSSIADTCPAEHNRKAVNQIYLSSWAIGELSFSKEDSATLLSIALQDPLASGDGVYSARVMLGIGQDDSGDEKSFEFISNQFSFKESPRFSKMYPNPSIGMMQLDYAMEKGQKAELAIYDLVGNKINAYIFSDSGILRISETTLESGIYFYEIIVNGESKETHKIIIIR